jgi:hypothetical protein
MTTSRYLRFRFANWLLIVSMALVCASRAQENAALPSSSQESPQSPAEVVQPAELKLLTNYVEGGGNYLALTNGFGNWTGGYARGVVAQGKNIWNAEVNGQREFGDAGVYFGAGDTYNFNPDWYGSLTLGTSAGGFFWPRFRADAFLNKKWLARKQLITTAGFGYYAAKDVHRDHSFFVGSTYYFREALDPRGRDSFQCQQSRICLLSGRVRRGDPRPQPAALHHAARGFWQRSVSTGWTDSDHNGFSEPDPDHYLAPVGRSALGRQCRGGLLSQPDIYERWDQHWILHGVLRTTTPGDPISRRCRIRSSPADIVAVLFPCTGPWPIFASAP